MTKLFDLTARDIGISSENWDYINNIDDLERAVGMMKSKRYDVLPIQNKSGSFTHFYVTNHWGRFETNQTSVKEIDEMPKLEAGTKFNDLLYYFESADHKYAILVEDLQPVGLISSVNFSWPEIYFRLYEVLFTFEVQLANWIFNQKDQSEILNTLIQSSEEQSSKQSTIGYYLIDERRGEDNHLKEYFFLSTLLNLVRSLSLHEKLGYSSKTSFAEGTKYLADIRNNIAHPVRRMIKKPEDFGRLRLSLETIVKLQANF